MANSAIKGSSLQNFYPAPERLNCCAVIVTFYPDEAFQDRFRCIQLQFPHIVIVDNSADKNTRHYLRKITRETTAHLIENVKNLGIAAALNQGLEYARQSGFLWITYFDQDSVIYGNFFSALIEAYIASGNNPVLLGSNYQNVYKQKPFLNCDSDHAKFCERKTVITSGFMLPLCIANVIGDFREDYFIDSVDHEYCLRARSYGFRILLSCPVTMSHSLGANTGRNAFEWSWVPNHSPIRKYYIARNVLTTIREYFKDEPVWAILQLLRLCIEFISILVFEESKIEKTKAFTRGLWHGLIKHMGAWDGK